MLTLSLKELSFHSQLQIYSIDIEPTFGLELEDGFIEANVGVRGLTFISVFGN